MGNYLHNVRCCFSFGVVVELKILAVLSVLFLIGFLAFYFPTYYNATNININTSLTFAPLIQTFGIMLLVLTALVCIAFALRGGK